MASTNTSANKAAVLHGAALSLRLGELGGELALHEPLWRGIAFREPRLRWESDHPRLARALRALPLAAAEALHLDPAAAAQWLRLWLPVQRWSALERAGQWPAQPPRPWPREFQRDVPGRKWAQLEAFCAAVGDEGLDAIDWCAGKGHLARAISQCWGARAVTALERDPRLVRAATDLARRAALPVAAQVCDVLDDAVLASLRDARHALALHACGDLHRRLLQAGADAALPAISCAPCCYHLAADPGRALSVAGSRCALGLRADDLRTAVQETVTAPAHVRRRRRHAQQWQLGFDCLQRECRGVDEYLPVPAFDAACVAGGFEQYCRGIAGQKGVELAGRIDFARIEQAGRERFREVAALDLVRHCWRRPLELWLVLDRAQYLVERGYHVGVGEFCTRELSPRNLLIEARRRA